MLKVAVIGSGHVGLVTGACFADQGCDVICVDRNIEWINAFKKGEVPFYEPDLQPLLQKGLAKNNIHFTDDIKTGIEQSTYIIITVGTPESKDGSADLSAVWNVADAIGQYANNYKCVVVKSTVPVGTTKKVAELINKKLAERSVDFNVDVVFNPEFLRQGEAVFNSQNPDRIVVGLNDPRADKPMRALYQYFIDKKIPFLSMDIPSAELSKYAANAMLATRISFMNEMSCLADEFRADIDIVRQVLSLDDRIGPHVLYAGCGYGGSCFPKDIKALRTIAKEYGVSVPLLESVELINDHQKLRLLTKIKHYFKQDIKGKRIAIWGLAFKKNTDDIRESPSRVMIEALLAEQAIVQIYDPMAMPLFHKTYGERENLIYCKNLNDALKDADGLVILTDWDEFKTVDLNLIKQNLKQPVIFDGRNIYDPAQMKNAGFHYYGIGRGEANG
ncbi:MAG: UDP-glucose/GDP-mannose dehydrogenase family protein [Gammaproteobacteria bacterium]|jgi:UDPglucose 6-dehydrogenase